ncbi:unnamed protein product [Closterium sp. NIES-65]|nr:unnamed protein product [Closterium sp. NIES-65]
MGVQVLPCHARRVHELSSDVLSPSYLNRNVLSGDVYRITRNMTSLVTLQPTSDRVTAIAPVALPAANQFPPYLPYTHRNFFFHGTIIPPEANLTYLGNAFEHCLLNASRAPGDYLEQRSAEECGAFFGVAAGDCQPLCSGHGMCCAGISIHLR